MGPSKDLGKISGFAWGIGYFGGLLSTAIVLSVIGDIVIENDSRLKLVSPITGVFFLIAGIPTFLLHKERGVSRTKPQDQNYLQIGWNRILQTLKEIKDFKDLTVFFVSLFFSQAGLSIIIGFAFIYGDQIIQWSKTTMGFMFVLAQFTAVAGALFFGYYKIKLVRQKHISTL